MFGNDESETPRKRRSIFKRDKSPDEKRDEVKRMILGQKRARPVSTSSPKSSPRQLPKKDESVDSKTPKTDSKPPEKRSRRSTRGIPVEEQESTTKESQPVVSGKKSAKETTEQPSSADKKADGSTRTRSRRSVTPAQNSK